LRSGDLADTEDLIIFQKHYDFMCYFFPVIDNFPKREKFTLCTRLKNRVYKILDLIIDANETQGSNIRFLNRIDMELKKLKIQVRFAKDRKHLSPRKQEIVIKKIDEIGRLLGGWIKSCKK
jgi:hypothetical protein